MASRLKSIELLKERIVQIKGAPEEAARLAAPLIEAKFRNDATTKRGNVPSYGERGNVPISATSAGATIAVTGPDWSMKIAQERGQVDEWCEIAASCAAEAMGSK